VPKIFLTTLTVPSFLFLYHYRGFVGREVFYCHMTGSLHVCFELPDIPHTQSLMYAPFSFICEQEESEGNAELAHVSTYCRVRL